MLSLVERAEIKRPIAMRAIGDLESDQDRQNEDDGAQGSLHARDQNRDRGAGQSPLLEYGLMSCAGTVTGITVEAGASPVHATVLDQNCNPVAPGNLGVVLSSSINGIVTVTTDDTGFLFSVANINQPATSGAATFTNAANGVHANLGVTVAPGGVTALEFTSP